MFDAGVWVLNVGRESFSSRLDAAQIRHPRFCCGNGRGKSGISAERQNEAIRQK